MRLHPFDDTFPDSIISQDTVAGFESVLGSVISSDELIQGLQDDTGILSNFFRMGITGVVINTGTGAVDANAGVTMVVQRGGGAQAPGGQAQGGLRMFYYREG